MLLAGHGNAVLAAEHGFIKNDERNFVASLQWSWRPSLGPFRYIIFFSLSNFFHSRRVCVMK
jgi:hypothetical protein